MTITAIRGRRALRTFAARLRNACRASDSIARLGGDEFSIVIQRMADRRNTKDTGLQIAEKVAAAFRSKGGSSTFKPAWTSPCSPTTATNRIC